LFGGAELFNIKSTLLFELAKSAILSKAENFYDIFSAFETGIDMSLEVPKFIVPMPSSWFPRRFRPRTAFSLGFNYQFRTYFERALANVSFGYKWRNTMNRQHMFNPFELTYVRFLNQQEEFQQQIENLSDLRLKYQYTNHLIMNTNYSFVYNTQRINTKTDFTYLSLRFETAGNLLYMLDKSFDMPTDSIGIYQLLGVPYSQYVRAEMDLKRYFYLSPTNTFVARMMLGIGVPYGNSISLPYEKSFYGGGPTTIRAWNIRTLGPGSYSNKDVNIFEKVGDMSLVINLEDRFPLFGMLEGAAFVDMGNIWLLRPSDEFPNGNFTFGTFVPDIAVGCGFGLRLNISIITLRLDFAIPFYDPQYAKGERWRMPHWKWGQIVTNFGIDYPF
jgi:outer membrane protein assembly factor BamA